jgi:molecular chaperone DnaK (HSP70)
LDWKDIDEILLVGGGAYMKPLSELVLTLSGKTPVIPPEPQMKAAEGAAICGASRGTGSDLFNYMDLRCPYTLALKYHKKGAEPDYRILVHSSERIPQGGLRKTFKHGVSSGKGSFFRAQLFELDIHTNPNRRLWQPAGELRISNLPPRKSDAPETVMIYLNCDEQFRITVTAKFRGEPVHIKVKEPTEQGHERPESVDMPQPTPEPFDPDDNIVGEDF